MSVFHIMADGTVRDSVAGLVVTNEAVYEVIDRVNKRLKKEAEQASNK